MGEWGLRSVYSISSPLLLIGHSLPLFLHGVPSTGYCPSKTDLAWASHRQQLLENCFRYGSVPWGPSLRSTLLQPGSPTGSSSCQVTCSCMGSSPGATALGQNLLWWGSSTGCSLLQCRSTCSTMVSFMAISLRRELVQGIYKVQLQTSVEKSDVRSDANPGGAMTEIVGLEGEEQSCP